MARVKKITVINLKAIKEQTADFNGCTAIITGGNNKGKTSFLRSLPDRIHGIKPDVILKIGEQEGFAEWQLTTGEKFIWSFDSKTKAGEKLTFITPENIKGPLTRELALRYFPPAFSVDDFLNAQPKKQKEMLQKLVGIDFSEIDKRYDEAYDDREGKNRRSLEEKIYFEKMEMPEEIQPIDFTNLLKEKQKVRDMLNEKYLENKKENEKNRKAWQDQVDEIRRKYELYCSEQKQEVWSHNNDVIVRQQIYDDLLLALKTFLYVGYSGDAETFVSEYQKTIGKEKKYIAPPEPQYPPEPKYISEMPDDSELKALDQKLADAAKINQQAQSWKDWVKQREKAAAAKQEAEEAQQVVTSIEAEKMEMIRSAKMPEGFGFNADGITYNNLPFTREQLSSSGIYIAALKLAAMTLGEVRTLHFDASFLDKKSLSDIEKWAESIDCQLLIERPDFEGGEIEYQLLNKTQ